MTSRSVSRIIDAEEAYEGGGFLVHRPFPTHALADFDPFLLLDEMGPSDLGPGEAKGAPDHPHRGFETVTYVLSGRMQHRDSAGHAGEIGPGDVQWMTAGSGVVHSEMPHDEILKDGGRMHGFQLWVNLPRTDKMMKPRYQEVPGSAIPAGATPDAKTVVKVIAGESLGAKAVIDTRTPIFYLHFTMQPGASVAQPVPEGFSAFAYLVEGSGRFGAERREARRAQMVLFGAEGDAAEIEAGESGLSALLIGGAPLREPVARYGPFVMNTPAEIYQAIEDYQNGRMGRI